MPSRKGRTQSVLALACFTGVAACTAILGLDAKPESDDAGMRADGPAGGKDAPDDTRGSGTGDVRNEASLSGCTADSTGFHSVTATDCWAGYDVSKAIGFVGGLSDGSGFAGGAFDGRYVYFASNSQGPFVRYDTENGDAGAAFTQPGSWESYVPADAFIDGGMLATAYAGAVYANGYVYFVAGGGDPYFLRYDTTGGDFKAASSWSVHLLAGPNAAEYAGGVYDGSRYIYFAPYSDPSGDTSGPAARLDTKSATAFTDEASWSYFDLPSVTGTGDAGVAQGYLGALFDGTYVYFVPGPPGGDGDEPALLARYDASGDFTVFSSWSTYDLTVVTPGSENGYQTGAFDGKHLYLAPTSAFGPGMAGPALQYTTGDPDAGVSAWSSYYANGVVSGATGFDGRFVYFAPGEAPNEDGGYNGKLFRFDTDDSFGDAGSWSSFDTANNPLQTGDFGAAVFDGRYLYLAPSDGTVVARFEARATSSMPTLPGYSGSFY